MRIHQYLICGLWAFSGSFSNAAPQDVTNAKNTAQSFNNHAGSVEDIQNNITNPLMTSDQMTTPDGTNFNAQLGCSANASFLEIFSAVGGSGDLTTLMIQQDTTMDGSYDRVWTPSIHVSGVCGNGIVSCDMGTWNNCQAYTWEVINNHELAFAAAPMWEMGGCYCVNNHCGSGLVINNYERVLSDLGGGAAAALGANNPYYAISNVTVSVPTISYQGQQTASCASGPANLSQYASNPNNFSADAFSTAATNNAYQLITTSSAATQDNSTYQTCEIRRNVVLDEITLNDIIDYDSGTGMVTPCGPACLQLTLGQVGDNYWSGSCAYYEHNVAFNILRPDRINQATLINAKWDDWIQVWANNQHIWNGPYGTWTGTGGVPGSCELGTSWNQNPNVDFTSALSSAGIVNFRIRVEVTGGGEGYAYAQINVDTSCQLEPDYITNSCNVYAQNPDCDLVEENVDGVLTYENYSATGLIPIEQTQTIVGSSCSVPVTRDWFVKNRTYRCKSNSNYDFTDALERQAYVTDNATTTTYQDRVKNPDNSYTVTNGSMQTLNEVVVEPCTQVCKTRRLRPANDVAHTGVVMDDRSTANTWDFFYHECDSNNACPLGTGEQVVKSCGCIDEWTEAATIMQVMRMSGGDVICTSGTPVPPQVQ